MGDTLLNCPLCCSKTFTNKQSLLEHLSNLEDLHCPVCSGKFPSLQRLTEHLRVDNCLPVHTVSNLIFEENTNSQNISTENNDFQTGNQDISFKALDNDADDNFLSSVQTLDSAEVNKMYVELMKPIDSQELKLMKDAPDRYVIVTSNDDFNQDTIVTKQNNDGTISLTTVKDIKLEPDTLISQNDQEPEGTGELYSCNTCGVSFASVIQHIQNFHNDQDVVIEGPIEDGDNDPLSLEYNSMKAEAIQSIEKQAPRRVITDTGDIVETPFLRVTSGQISVSGTTVTTEVAKEQTPEKKGTNRYAKVDKLCVSVVKDLDQNDIEGPYHKVVVKDVKDSDGNLVKTYRCMWCNIVVKALGDFKQHPCKTLRYKCNQCEVAYDNAKSLCAHMKVHKTKATVNESLEVLETFECEICCTEFHTNKSLKLHKRMHDPPKNKPIDPPEESEEESKFLCKICSKMIPLEYEAIHSNYHKTDDTLNCGVCNKKFSSLEFLEMHANVHNTEKTPGVGKQDQTLPYWCMYCDRRFARPHEKVKHERIHTGEKPHSCEICGKSFRVSYCLTLHMRTHTGARPYECPHCGKRFKAHSVYNHHLLTHSEVRAYKCPYCPKAFKTSVQLAGHKNSHTKPFSCTQCNRPFASLYAVRVHTETHSRQNNLKFSCKMCGASYARAFALKDHIKQVHKVEPTETLTENEDWEMKEVNLLELQNDETIVST